MLKKILLWIFYTAFVGVLIFGALNRTMVKVGDDGAQNSNASERELARNLENRQTYGKEDSAASHPDTSVEYKENEHDVQVAEHEWVALTGEVSSILPRGMVVTDADGRQIEIARRPWRFAQEQGFAPQVGDQVTLDGFYENGEFEAARLTNTTNGQIVYLRDDAGHPLWASGGSDH